MTQWSAELHKKYFGNTSAFQALSSAPFHFLFDVTKLLILLVQAWAFDQTFVVHNSEISFLEGQELSNQIDPNKAVTA